MESFNEFLERINSFEKPVFELPDSRFEVNSSLKNKVDADNKFKPFFGDTTVFDLTDITKKNMGIITDELYKRAGECFCEKLKSDTFHVTLHDLSNSSKLSDIGEEMFNNEINLLQKVYADKIVSEKIVMQTNYVINMVGTSLVLALKPKTEEDYIKLMNLYDTVDGVKSLPYPLTPHITLAYYNPNGFSAESAKKLAEVVNELNEEISLDVTLFTKKLYYEKFTDMNSYYKVFPLTSSYLKTIPVYNMRAE